jgi:hypothetical protein
VSTPPSSDWHEISNEAPSAAQKRFVHWLFDRGPWALDPERAILVLDWQFVQPRAAQAWAWRLLALAEELSLTLHLHLEPGETTLGFSVDDLLRPEGRRFAVRVHELLAADEALPVH